MKNILKPLLLVAVLILIPGLCSADTNENLSQFQGILDGLYKKMMPMCSELTDVAKAIAAFGALWYISFRVWRHLTNAEPIDFYPLFRPFVLGFCIINFTLLMDMINGLLKPIVTGTGDMVKNSNVAVKVLLKKKEDALKDSDIWQMYVGNNGEGDRAKWYKYTYPKQDAKDENMLEAIGNNVIFAASKYVYGLKNQIKVVVSELLQIIFECAALCINTLRTFQMIVLSIIGPLVFGLAVFDGLQNSLSAWLARFINVFLWLPVANIFGAIIGNIQEELLKLDILQIKQTGDTFFSETDISYIVFLIIGIVGYFTVPSVATFIVNGGSGDAMTKKISDAVSNTGSRAIKNMKSDLSK